MTHYLVVANQTLGGERLRQHLTELAAAVDASFHFLVPATEPADHAFRLEGEGITVAKVRLERALERFGNLGAEVTGEIGDHRPADAIDDALRTGGYDAIVLSTLPAGMSRWLGMDLPHRVQRRYDLPLTHIEAEPEVTAADVLDA